MNPHFNYFKKSGINWKELKEIEVEIVIPDNSLQVKGKDYIKGGV